VIKSGSDAGFYWVLLDQNTRIVDLLGSKSVGVDLLEIEFGGGFASLVCVEIQQW
ncbi:hypothetical protein U1Q18_025743, partial [Sarracenia purpurea var. burkii]